jgi:hypothetical protein
LSPLPRPKSKPADPIRTHVEMLHQIAAGVDGLLVVSVFHASPTGEEDRPGTVTHHPVGDVEGMIAAIEAHRDTPGANVYCGLQVMRRTLGRGKRGEATDIVAVLGLVADMDGDTGRVGDLPLEPNLVLETSPGNGQPFWLFDRPLPPAEAKPLAKALKRATGSDHGTGDIAHVWRVPGTLNWPNKKKIERGRPKEPAEVTTAQDWDGSLTSVDALADALAPWLHAEPEQSPFKVGDLPNAALIDVAPGIATMLAANDVGDRSAYAARVVEQLAFDGHSAEEALALFLSATGDWFLRYETEERARADFLRLWGKFGQPHKEAREAGAGAAEGLLGKKAKAAANDNAEAAPEPDREEPDYTLAAVADLEVLTSPGGLVQDLVDWIVSSAEQPSRTLALAAALPMVAALMGARYSTGSRDTRPNIYTVALAESGFGKEHARSQIKRLIMGGQGLFDKFSGPARIMSASALREVLEEHQSVNCQIDEFGGFVRDITDRKAGSHQRAISTDLRDYYSASSTFFEGAAYRGNPPKRIYNPNLCIHGTSTPEQFWSALSSASAEDGLLPRLILFNVDGARQPPVKPHQDVRYVPTFLLERMLQVTGLDGAKTRIGNLGGKIQLPKTSSPISPRVVPWSDDALTLFEAVQQSIDAQEVLVAAEARPFVRRILENAVKLALIAAVGTDPVKPIITEPNVDWAASLAWTCAAGMLSQVTERLSDSPREANYKRIAGLIRDAGPDGITLGRIGDRLKGIDARQREEIIKDMRAAGRVFDKQTQTSGRPRQRLVWAT